MTRDQFRAALAHFDLTQGTCARWLDIDERTVRRWATDGPPKSVALLFSLMRQVGIGPDGFE